MDSPSARSVLNVLLRVPAVVLVHLACRTYDVIWSVVAASVVGLVLASGVLVVWLFPLVSDLYRWCCETNRQEVTIAAVLLTIPFYATSYVINSLRSASLDLVYSMSGLVYHFFTHLLLSSIYITLAIIIQFLDFQKLMKLYRLGLALGLTIVGAYSADILVDNSSNLHLLFGVLCFELVISFSITFLLELSSNKVYFFAAYSLPVLSAIAGLSYNTVALSLTAANIYTISFLVVLPVVCFRQAYEWLYAEAKRMYVANTREEYHATLYNNKINLQLIIFSLGYIFITHLTAIIEHTESIDTINNCPWYLTSIIHCVTCCNSFPSHLSVILATKFVSYLLTFVLRSFLQWNFEHVNIGIIVNVIASGFPFFNVSSDCFLLIFLSTIWLSWKDTLTFHQGSYAVLLVLHDLVPSLLDRIVTGYDDVVASMATSYLANKGKHIRIVTLNVMFLCLSLWMIWVTVSDTNLIAFIALLGFRSWLAFAARPLSTLMTYSAFVYDQISDEPWAYFNDALLGAKVFPVAINFIGSAVSIPLSIVFWYNGQLSFIAFTGLFFVLIVKIYLLFMFGRSWWIKISAQRQTVSQVDDLPLVSADELAEKAEQCAVCYQIMTSARRLSCGHCFHSPCLKKWVYVQMVCPVCRAPMKARAEETAPIPEVPDREEVYGEDEHLDDTGSSSEDNSSEERRLD